MSEQVFILKLRTSSFKLGTQAGIANTWAGAHFFQSSIILRKSRNR